MDIVAKITLNVEEEMELGEKFQETGKCPFCETDKRCQFGKTWNFGDEVKVELKCPNCNITFYLNYYFINIDLE